jgi:hypothetical protein
MTGRGSPILSWKYEHFDALKCQTRKVLGWRVCILGCDKKDAIIAHGAHASSDGDGLSVEKTHEDVVDAPGDLGLSSSMI